jgi:hypothetical protein
MPELPYKIIKARFDTPALQNPTKKKAIANFSMVLCINEFNV